MSPLRRDLVFQKVSDSRCQTFVISVSTVGQEESVAGHCIVVDSRIASDLACVFRASGLVSSVFLGFEVEVKVMCI